MEQTEFSLREWGLKARTIGRENTNSRRFSGSHIRGSFRDPSDAYNAWSFRSISSTASSPGCATASFKDEIDPSTYSFTAALKALQARSSYNCWECLSPEGFALNSKWNDAEKYICNPLSGEVPMECLSAKTLSGRSFRLYTNRITMSAPLVYSSSSSTSRPFLSKPGYGCDTPSTSNSTVTQENGLARVAPVQEEKVEGMGTRDVGIQSATPELSSSSPSPAWTPPIVERSLKRCEADGEDSPNLTSSIRAKEEEEESRDVKRDGERKKEEKRWRCGREGGCLSWMRKRTREKHKSRKKNIHNVAESKDSETW